MSATHGLASTYRNAAYNCRCAPCTKANSDRAVRERASRKARLAGVDVEHGRASTYVNWGCRCVSCTAANTDAGRQRALRNPK